MNRARQKSIFLDAIEETNLARRTALVTAACGDDQALRAGVEALISAHESAENPLDHPIVGQRDTDEYSDLIFANQALEPLDPIGQMIGPYRLMEKIGEGGFGLVYVAQQEHPVRRNVALKIVKPGMGSKDVIARFEAERQAVAMMDHPNIAQVFDAGVIEGGRPYFVMELVRGVPVTEFADAHQLNIRQRLELFTDICAAVQHAHQKGVIHRDLKPANVMVTLHDTKPVVKVIDFGVVKAIGAPLTDKTIYTRFMSMIGTPLYMSPEQAEMSGLDIDTRSDIFSLGVMMYELLTGVTPFDRARIDSAGLDELRRIIREEEPPRPSRRLTTLGDRLTSVSSDRRLEPSRLGSLLRGDLDWIVMKALEKDRERRYESASALADDVDRYLTEQPINARPPTLAYQLSKFSRRHRVVLGTLSLILITMMIGTAISLWQMASAISERDQKEQALQAANAARQEIEQFATKVTIANSLVASGQAHANAGRWKSASADYNESVLQQPSYYLPWVARAQFYTQLRLWDEAADDFEMALKFGAPTDTPQWWGAMALFKLTRRDAARRTFSSQLDERLKSDSLTMDWQLMRDFVAVDDSELTISRAELVELSEAWLEERLAMDARINRGPPPPFGSPQGQPRPHDRQRPPPPPRSSRDPFGRRPPLDDLPPPVYFYIDGLTYWRAGEWDQAIERLESTAEDRIWPSRGMAFAPLAIAYFQADRVDDAQLALAKSKATIERIAKQMLDDPNVTRLTPWFDLVELLVLHREASELITGADDSVVSTALQKMREQSAALIFND